MNDESAGTAVTGTTQLTVHAEPDKLFFIENLIKDIELIPAILDLADNSIDSARYLALQQFAAQPSSPSTDGDADGALNEIDLPAGAYSGLRIDIVISPEKFEIRDNCAGMTLDLARMYAFRFGRPQDFTGVPGSVGEFGVGMKRALFKLGRWFQVQSRSATEWFDLEVDVNKWIDEAQEDDWTFRFKSARTSMPEATSDERGTLISVRELHPSVREDFEDDLVLSLLREQLRLRHQVALDLGLVMTLNEEQLSGLRPTLMSGPGFRPIRRSFLVDESPGTVLVEIIAGIVQSDRRDASQNDGDAENFKSTSEAGWWVFCNNRLLLVGDKSKETGWGNGAASYHPQYRLFRGYVYMSTPETSLLPWNTTKTGVDTDSRVWRKVQNVMLSILVEVQSVLNRLKKEREEVVEDDEGEPDVPLDAVYIRALSSAAPTPLKELSRSSSFTVPSIPKRTTPPRRTAFQKIQYDVTREQFDKAMSLGFPSAAHLGRRSFEYFYKREVDDS